MHAPASHRVERTSLRPSVALSAALLLAALAAGCGGGGGGGGQSGIPGQEGTKESGESFIIDENQSGSGANVHLAETLWGRLVDVHQIDALGNRVDPPVFRDFVIHPNILTDNVRFVLDRNPVTLRERLVIQNIHGPDPGDIPPGEDRFLRLLAEASDPLPLVADKDDDGTSSPPFTAVPRNACIVLRFDDCLDDDEPASLVNLVRVFTGYPPITPFAARVVFDPNHGGMVGGRFHTTRVLVDMTVSQVEALSGAAPLVVNAVGMPASLTSSSSPNISVRVPSEADVGSGQPKVLTNLSGVSLDLNDNGPIDELAPTQDVVRAVRSGNSDDQSNGFLRDLEKPRVIGGWSITVDSQASDPAGEPGLDFLIDLTFLSTCQTDAAVGDVITRGPTLVEVTEARARTANRILGLHVRSAFPLVDDGNPSTDEPHPADLLGDGLYHAPFQTSVAVASGCWVSFLPEADAPPTTGVETDAQVLVRFSEPMDPESLSPFGGVAGGMMVVRGAAGAFSTAISSNIVVGEVLPADQDLTAFNFVPTLPYPHTGGAANDTFHLELSERATDLAGNRLRNAIPFVDFTIFPLEEEEKNSAIVLRFEGNDEYAPDGADADAFADAPDGLQDIRGQFFFDRGMLLPRPVAFGGWPADQSNPVPLRMVPVAGGVFTPLNPLGAKLQTLWRYCDLGWAATDETKYNLDVIGLNWSPFGAQVLSDFYDQFEIQLGHCRFLPDEGPPLRAASGLPTTAFEDNYLSGSNPIPGTRGGFVVHNRALGYIINPAELFNATSGTPMIPYPFNQGGGSDVTYTWRDTSILAKGADGDPAQKGIPMECEFAAGVINGGQIGDLGGPRNVPSFGLPLLIEIRCHPSNQGLGFNLFGVAIGNASAVPVPAFRAFSSGGVNTLGNQEEVLPDAELAPRGGFNPLGTPPGARTRFVVDSIFYLGQLDTVVRISRVHTVWLDAGQSVAPIWRPAVLEPSLSSQPTGTNIIIDYRAAFGFVGSGTQPFDGTMLDPYGNTDPLGAPQPQQPTDWSRDIGVGDNRRFLQVRLTYVNNIETRTGAELDALALPYVIQ
jgi:hypothetical protein